MEKRVDCWITPKLLSLLLPTAILDSVVLNEPTTNFLGGVCKCVVVILVVIELGGLYLHLWVGSRG